MEPNVIIISNSFENLLQLIGLIIIFVLILIATYYTTHWIGNHTSVQSQANNIRVIETFRLSQTKYIQIIKVGGSRYFAIAVCKDTIEYLGELEEEDLTFVASSSDPVMDFAQVLKHVSKDTMTKLKRKINK